MDRLISEQEVIKIIDSLEANFTCYDSVTLNEVYSHVKAIPTAESQDSEDKIIRWTLENFMRGLWEEIQVGELEYTTSEVYEMLEREIFTDNHVAIPSAEQKTGHWIQTNEFFINQDGQFIYKFICSECKSLSYFRKSNKKAIGANVCPNCGAKMVEPQAESEDKE